ncbi:T9SS type B sorting domain-containing protein [Flavilitoribacter nigricans]|nr:T9SS type B sorting domain-containing protein [Flavilitoribacter nigricans]
MGFVLWTGGQTYAQCPSLKAIMVDPCGDEVRNEFIILDSGTGFNTGDLQISFDISGNGSGEHNNDININVGNVPGTRPCRFQPGNAALVTGCPNVQVVSQDEEIPPNAVVIIQTSGNANEPIDFSYLCGNGECVYVLQNDCVRSIEAFSNRGTGTRTSLIALANTLCNETVVYDRNQLVGGDGAFYAPDAPTTYENRGCGITPPVTGGTIPPEFVNPGNLFGCGSLVLPSVTGMHLTNGERYYTGPYGTGVSYASGSVITRSTTLFIFDETAPCSPLEMFRVNIADPVTPNLTVPNPLCAQDTPYTLETTQDGIEGTWTGDGVSNNLFDPDQINGATYDLTFVPNVDECAEPNSIEVVVLDTPVAGDNLRATACNANGAGIGIFDLTAYASEINGGTNDQVLWYEDVNLTNIIADSTLYSSGAGQIYAVIDNGACLSDPVPVELVVGRAPTIRFVTIGTLSCFGDTDGSIEIEITGGTPPYNISWSNPAYDNQTSLTDLPAGSYGVTVTDAIGCSSNQMLSIIEPNELILDCNKLQDVGTVIGDDGVASFTASGGIAPYWVVWEGPETDSAQIFSANDTLTVSTLRAGTYQVRVRDALGCVAFCQVDIDAPNCDLEVSGTFTEPQCFGEADGSITLTPTGAQGNLTYSWNVSSLNGQNAPQNLAAGQYEVTVTDETGCSEILSFLLESPPMIDLNCSVQNPVSVLGGSDGRARIQVSGGSRPYRASWTGPKTGDISIGMATEFVIDSLPAGTYDLVVVDANNCEQTCSFTVADGNCSNGLDVDISDESCPGSADGSIRVILTGNWISPVTYDWDNDAFDGQSQLSGLAAGNYTVTVTGANNCQSSISATVETDFSPPAVSFTENGTVCSDECYDLELNFTGTAPFFAEFILRSGNQSNPLNVNTDQMTDILTICPADYGVTSGSLRLQLLRVSDANCINEETRESVIDIAQPTEANYTATLCPNESVVINGQTYDINRPTGTEVLIGANEFGCDSTVNITLNFASESVNEITDTLCPDGSITINGQTYDINRPSGMEIIPNGTGCDSLININLSFYPPATGRLEEVLCPGEVLIINGVTYNEQRLSGIEMFPGGSSNGCDSTLEISISYYPEAVGFVSDTICPGETITVNGTDYNRENPFGQERLLGEARNGCDSLVEINLSFFDAPMSVLRDTLCRDASLTVNGTVYDINRPSGMEVFSGSGENGCDSLVQVDLIFQEDVTVALVGDQDICMGEEAVLEFRVLNALTPIDVQYAVNGGNPTWIYGVEDGDVITVKPNDNTTYSVVQALVPPEFCTVTIGGDATVRVSMLMVDVVTDTDYLGYGVSCADQQDGAIRAMVMSGTGPFEFVWQDGVRMPERTNLGPGVYSVVVTDALGCTAEAFVQLEAPPPIQMRLSTLPLDCDGGSSGAVILDTVFGGIPAYFYSIDGGTAREVVQTPLLITDIAAGRHTIEISDEFGCSTRQDVVIAEFTPLELILGPDQKIRYGESVRLDGVANFQIDSLYWVPSDSLQPTNTLPTRARPSETTTYTLRAFDSRGCWVEDEIKITVIREDDIYVPNAFSPNSDGINDRVYPFTNPNIKIINEFRIFDRWGNQMHYQQEFHGNQEKFGWDGIFNNQPMDPAVFIFVLHFTYLDGQPGMLKGDITLVR